METVIRPATLSDCSNIVVLKQQVWISTYATEGLRNEFSNYVLSEFTQEKVKQSINDSSLLMLVAELQGHIIGCAEISLQPEQPTAEHKSSLEITVLYVLEKFQGVGVGGLLIEACTKHIKSLHFNQTWLTVYFKNEKAIEFYKKHNFIYIGNKNFILDGNKYKNLIMLKEI